MNLMYPNALKSFLDVVGILKFNFESYNFGHKSVTLYWNFVAPIESKQMLFK